MVELQDETFRQISGLMYKTMGLSLGDSKKPLVSSRLGSRIQRLGMGDFDDYLALISGAHDDGEFQVAVDLLTTNETYFFREPEHFAWLEKDIEAQRLKAPAIWSAASSFGDEAFSIAMLLADLQQKGRISPTWSILGTDISDRVLRSASQAIYPEDRLRHVAPRRLKQYCLRGDGDAEGLVQIQPKLREHVRFGQLNLCRPIEDIGPFDVIFLRNVLIYFDAPTKREVVDRVLTQLKPGGLFFIGSAEGRVACDTPLKPIATGVFRKVAT
ncbi:CheR family methyltransferase [Aquabacterium sp.]|uniref:CheR family methyltransferase n=1 Tax=Aquabacterium sp. TaxID=1872578 RepID=UPI0019896B5E|nr:CheR family methyltransferase [Aquabacterium sp.]MBC7702087.1 SAM-dependent methyltransferase [Aquabacterium sp.]